jgi:hypothetical protein
MIRHVFFAWLGIVSIALLVALGCAAKPWPDSVLPDADSKAVLPDEVRGNLEPDSRFKDAK